MRRHNDFCISFYFREALWSVAIRRLSLAKRPDYLFTDNGFNAAEDDVLFLVIAFGFIDRNAQILVLLMGKQSLCAAKHHGNPAVCEGVVELCLTSARLHSRSPFSVHA